MKPYVKLYMDYFGYDVSDFIPCEVCGAQAVDFGIIDKTKVNNIFNVIAICLKCSNHYLNKLNWEEWLKKIHKIKLEKR